MSEPISPDSKDTLDQRIQGVVEILTESNYRLSRSRQDYFAKFTGFVQEDPARISKVVKFLRQSHPNTPLVSLDLACGDGAWTLIAAAAGFPSYGIDANGYLINKARKNHERAVKNGFIEPETVCKFAAGNIYTGDYIDDFARLADDNTKEHMPTRNFGKPYDELGITVGDADIIYSWQWGVQMPF